MVGGSNAESDRKAHLRLLLGRKTRALWASFPDCYSVQVWASRSIQCSLHNSPHNIITDWQIAFYNMKTNFYYTLL